MTWSIIIDVIIDARVLAITESKQPAIKALVIFASQSTYRNDLRTLIFNVIFLFLASSSA
jgi:hypothetical protein